MSNSKKTSHRTYSRQPTSDDRRAVCRYGAVETRAWLGWWEQEKFHSTNAHIVDISLRGCQMSVDQLPPKGQAVWFCPPGATPSEWIEARLIESKRRLFGPRIVRIEFHHPFAYETFKHMVYGPEALGGQITTAGCVPESERDYW